MIISDLFKDAAALTVRAREGRSALSTSGLRGAVGSIALVAACVVAISASGRPELAKWLGVGAWLCINVCVATASVRRSSALHRAREGDANSLALQVRRDD